MAPTAKRCTRCGEEKPIEAFGTAGKYKQSWCRGCEREYRCLPEMRAAAVKRASDWAKANPERRRELANEVRARRIARGATAADWAKRHAAKTQRTPPWLAQAHLAEIEGVYHFAKVMEQITGEKYHVDHIEPLQGRRVSGLHVPWNLQAIPAQENLKKHNRRVGTYK